MCDAIQLCDSIFPGLKPYFVYDFVYVHLGFRTVVEFIEDKYRRKRKKEFSRIWRIIDLVSLKIRVVFVR